MCAPWSTKIDKFLALVVSSHIVELSTLAAACTDFSTNSTDESAISDLCRHLIGKGLLTEWQCEKLCEGKWKGFWLDNYCLLAELNRSGEGTAYLAKEWRTEKQVALVVSPPKIKPWVNGHPFYRVEELPNQMSSDGK
jgi:serine/threonine-protein kinase